MSSKRAVPLSAIAFVVSFVVGVVASSPPKNSASDATWIANYTGHAHKAGHIVSGVSLIIAGLALLALVTSLWSAIAERRAGRLSPLPVAAAATGAACMAVGGVLMGGVTSIGHVNNADILRLGNDVGFVMVGLGGMVAFAVSLAGIAIQARAAGVFGGAMTGFTFVVAVVMLASLAFFPIVLLLIWSLVVAYVMARGAPSRDATTAVAAAGA